jgi:hypothetical protein
MSKVPKKSPHNHEYKEGEEEKKILLLVVIQLSRLKRLSV